MRQLGENMGLASCRRQSRNIQVASMRCLDGLFIWHLDAYAVVCWLGFSMRCADQEEMSGTSSVGYGIGMCWD